MCYKSGKFPNGVTNDHISMIERAKEMGQVRMNNFNQVKQYNGKQLINKLQ